MHPISCAIVQESWAGTFNPRFANLKLHLWLGLQRASDKTAPLESCLHLPATAIDLACYDVYMFPGPEFLV